MPNPYLPPLGPDGQYVYPDGSKILLGNAPGLTTVNWAGRWKPKPGAPNGAYLTDCDSISYFDSPEAVARALEEGGEGPCSLPGYVKPGPPKPPPCEHLPDPASFIVPARYNPVTEGGAVVSFRCLKCGATGNAKLGGTIDLSTLEWDEPSRPRWANAAAWLRDRVKEWVDQKSVEELSGALLDLANEVDDEDIQVAFFSEMEQDGYGQTSEH